MLARDFVDEQRYVIEKLRHHNQKLHGAGVVCGLKVVQHEKDGMPRPVRLRRTGSRRRLLRPRYRRPRARLRRPVGLPAIKALRDKATVGDRHEGAHAPDLHPVPRMRDRAGTGALRRVRLRRRQVRAEPDTRVVRDRRPRRPAHCRPRRRRFRHSAATSGRTASTGARTATCRTAWCWRRSSVGGSATRSSDGPAPRAGGIGAHRQPEGTRVPARPRN